MTEAKSKSDSSSRSSQKPAATPDGVPDLGPIADIVRSWSNNPIPDYASLLAQISPPIPRLRVPMVIDSEQFERYRGFERQVLELRARMDEQARSLQDERESKKKKEQRLAELEATVEELREKERIAFLYNRVNARAQRQLLASDALLRKFSDSSECNAAVMAVDIRRSTELMLKARTPEAFAEFTTTLCTSLMGAIVDHDGVFDKFTGDGVLASFPDFFTGPDSVYQAIAAADACHAIFKEHYLKHRRSFSSVLRDTGLGIGIDIGAVRLVEIAGGLTVVGVPVVYACRLASGPPTVTLVNQPAYEVICERFAGACFVRETEVDIKHEGHLVAYAVHLSGRKHNPAAPPWVGHSK